jgi:hypothetical protein
MAHTVPSSIQDMRVKIRMVSGTVSDFDRCARAQSELCEGARYFQSLEEWPRLPFTARIERAPLFHLPPEGGLGGLPLRVSNEGLPRPRVARAQETL